ncbi:MAG: hypothetical protein IBJ11_09005 [Phycisphaerales bacterium]|nr:hypothetical protein [Phycisphaerales bacterium]
MTRAPARVAILALALSLARPAAHAGADDPPPADLVELRGGQIVAEPIEGVDLRGIRLKGPAPRLLSWDSVKLVTGPHAEAAAKFADVAEKAWRARIRLARADLALAAPLFDELFALYEHEPGPTALMAAEGALACRVAAGDRPGAIRPWLRALALRLAGQKIDGDPRLDPVLDPETLLLPALPPVFVADDSTRALADSLAQEVLPGDGQPPLAAALSALYRRAAAIELAEPLPEPPPRLDHPALTLVRDIVDARSDDAGVRAAARARLEAGLAGEPGGWREAWRRAALGRSLLREPDPAARSAGLFQLFHLPARFAPSQPYLAGVALAEASAEMARRGNAAAAAELRDRLAELDPRHPALAWLRALPPPASAAKPAEAAP